MDTKNYTILFVDDEKSNLDIYKIYFQRKYNVLLAETGEDALKALAENKVHVLVTDQKMPRMSGTELLRSTLEKFPDLIKIIVTGFSDLSSVKEAVNKCDMYRYVDKPLEFKAFELILKDACELWELRDSREAFVRKLETAKETLEKEVARQTADLSDFLSNAQEYIFSVNTRGEIIFANRYFHLKTSYEAGQDSAHIRTIFTESAQEEFKQNLLLLAPNRHVDFSADLIGRSGEAIQAEGNVHAYLPEEGGKVLKFFLRDVSARNRAGAELKRSEEIMHAHFHSAEDGFILFDLAAEALVFNDSTEDFFSILNFPEPRPGMLFEELTKHEKTGNFAELFAQAVDGISSTSTIHVEFSNGMAYWFDFHFEPSLNRKNQIFAVSVNIRDISARMMAELRMEEALKFSKELDFAVDSAALVSMTDASGIITYVNRHLSEISGYEPLELLGKTHNVLRSDEHDKAFFVELWKTISSGKIWKGEIKNRRKDGSFYWVDSTIVPFLDTDGKPKTYTSIRFDISDRKAAEKRNKELTAMALSTNNDIQEKMMLLDVTRRKLDKKQNELEVKNRLMSDSIRYGSRVQQALFGKRARIRELFPDAFVIFRPRDLVSGDFFFFAETETHKIVAAVDCTGHGVPGGFLSMSAHAFLTEIVVSEGFTDPGVILTKLNERFAAAAGSGGVGINKFRDGMEIGLFVSDKRNGTAEFAGARRPLYIFRKNELIEIKGDSDEINGKPGSVFTGVSPDLQAGDSCYLFSDGFQDQIGGKEGRKYLRKGMKEFLARISPLSCREQEDAFNKELNDWQGDHKQIDDILFMGFRPI